MFVSLRVKRWRQYQFYVTAMNELGESELSQSTSAAQCVTSASRPTRNPHDVCSRLDSPRTLVIVWQVRLHTTGPSVVLRYVKS